MKRHLLYGFLFALVATGCNQEELSVVPQTDCEGRPYSASFEDNETRTYVEDGILLRWTSGDQISLFDGNTLNRQYKFDGETGDNSGTFSIVSTPYGSYNDLTANFAVYPYASDTKIAESGVMTVTLPAEQAYAENSFGASDNTMVAVTENTEDTFLKFKNVCGYLKLQLYGNDVTVKSITLTGNNNEKLAGKATVIPAYGQTPTLAMSDDATTSITLDCGEGVKIGTTDETATAFWIVVPPTTFEGGFEVTITDISGDTFAKSTSNEIAIERNVIKPMKTFEVIFENETEDEGSSNDYIDEYGINHGKGVEISGVVWAPVNCGYHKTDFKYGKLYQWGRKYGQGYNGNIYDATGDKIGEYSDATIPMIEEGGISVMTGNDKSNADIFYTKNTNYYDWKDSQDGKLWNYGTEDNPVKTEYDPCPDGWRVPTYAELDELRQNHSNWTYENEQLGYWFSGSVPYSSSVFKVFFPAAGLREHDGLANERNTRGFYWSSRSNDNRKTNAYCLSFYDNRTTMGTFGQNYANGFSVRCVKYDGELIPVSSLILDETSISMAVGEVFSIPATINPSNASHQYICWRSDDPSIAIVDSGGTVTAVSAGTTTITAVAGMQVATCKITVSDYNMKYYIDEYGVNHGKGVKIGDVVWAPVNCGYHKNDFKYGKLYQWGRKYGQGYSGNIYDANWYKIGEYSDASLPMIEEGGISIMTGNDKSNADIFYTGTSDLYDWADNQGDKLWNSGTEDNPVKTEYDPCPDGWRVPTYAELDELRQNHSNWTYENEQLGYWFSGSVPYSSSVFKVFFPAAGLRAHDGITYNRGGRAYYYSSITYNNFAYCLWFTNSGEPDIFYSKRACGYSVRCVQE